MSIEVVLQQTRADCNAYLATLLDQRHAEAAHLNRAMHYALVLGGKRIRPFLTLQIGRLCGAPEELLWRAAAALECIHAYSLVHDDLPAMDNDVLRRGQPTCHIAFDEATAILAGDALQALAFELLSKADAAIAANQQLAMIQCLAVASGDQGMCGGQALDLAATGQQLDEQQLQQVHQHKTGALIRAAAQLGVLAGSQSAQPYFQQFDQFTAALGLAFQVQDDILDIEGDTAVLGKPQGSDLQANKSTYPSLLGLEQAKLKSQQLYENALNALAQIPADTTQLAQLAAYIVSRDH